MEVTIYVTGTLCLITSIVAALLGTLGHRDLTIWTSFVAVCLAVLTGFCWLQNYHWNKDANAANTETAGDIARRDQRAWVAPIAFSGEPKPNQPFTAYVRYKNTGKTLAKNVRIVFCAYGVRKGEKPNLNVVDKEPSEGGGNFMLPPNGESESYHSFNNGVVLTENDVRLVNSGEVVVFAFGKIYYGDIFNCDHWTTFCVTFDPTQKRYSVYSEYNEADDNCGSSQALHR